MDMPKVRPHRECDTELAGLPDQPEGPNPAKRPRLQKPADSGFLAELRLEEPLWPNSQESTTVVCLGAGCSLKLHLKDFDLLLEPDPNSVRKLLLPGHTIFVVPEGLQNFILPGQPACCPTIPQEAALLDMPHDHGVMSQQGASSACLSDIQGLGNAFDPHEDSGQGFVMPLPWMNAPAGMVPALLLPFPGIYSPMFQGQVPWPWDPRAPPDNERYAPGSIWSMKATMVQPGPSSPLQPLPPSPPESHQEGTPLLLKPQRPHCKAKRRLF